MWHKLFIDSPLKLEENKFLYYQRWSSTLEVQLEQLKQLKADSHAQVYWIFREIWPKYGQWCYRFKFLQEIRLHWLLVGFGEIRFLKWHDVINSNSWFLAILKDFSDLPLLFKLIFFFSKLNRILTKIGTSCVKS